MEEIGIKVQPAKSVIYIIYTIHKYIHFYFIWYYNLEILNYLNNNNKIKLEI